MDCKFSEDSKVIQELKNIFPEHRPFYKGARKIISSSLLTGKVETTADLQKIIQERKSQAVQAVRKIKGDDIEYIKIIFLWKNRLLRYLMARKIRRNADKYYITIVAELFKTDPCLV